MYWRIPIGADLSQTSYRAMHEEPFLFNYRVGNNTKIKSGYVIAIEPMLNLGCDDVYVEEDKWGVVTKDHKPSAHFEHTVLATDDEPILMTTLMEQENYEI